MILCGHYGVAGHLGRIHVTTDFVQERGIVQEAILTIYQKLHNMEEKEIALEISMKNRSDGQHHIVNVIIHLMMKLSKNNDI